MAEAEQNAVREELFKRLCLDLIGPEAPDEVLVQDFEARTGDSPLSRYLMGILYPTNSVVPADEDDFANEGGESEDDDSSEPPVIVTGIPKPTSIGMSFALEREIPVELMFRYGLYTPTEVAVREPEDAASSAGKPRRKRPSIRWSREQIEVCVPLKVDEPEFRQELPGGAEAEWISRPDGAFVAVTVFLRNRNQAEEGPDPPGSCLYQPQIMVRSVGGGEAIVDRSFRSGKSSYDPEIQSYRMLYRDKPEFVVGHTCGADWDNAGCSPHRARHVWTDLIPRFEVCATEAKGGLGIPGLDMTKLAEAPNAPAIQAALLPLAEQYADWIRHREEEVANLPPDLQGKAREHLGDCDNALLRIRAGLKLINDDPQVLEAFRFANRVMALQRTKSVEALNYQKGLGRIYTGEAPAWRPFQVAFFLLNLEGIVRPDSCDRETVDLLWFPTGGGKTEAYLGLAAFTMGLRRIRHMAKPSKSASGDGGVTVLMRYTLRLLTIQQFQRATTMICACEVLRRKAPERLGNEPFSIALWVGGGATPNHIDQKPDPQYGREPSALQALDNFDPEHEPSEGNPVQLRACPWCGETLSYLDYRVSRELLHLQIRCPNEQCNFHGADGNWKSGIPAFLVDEDIYLRCPTMLIGTVDKFARLPWDDRTKALFGRVDRRCDRHDFLAEGVDYEGKCGGKHLAKAGLLATSGPHRVPAFLPPELVIQDELHLMTGPLGSLMGLYEAAVDFICSNTGYRPKVIASTATIRRYQDQIRGLFDRSARQFPPPGLNAGDSFFAAETKDKPGRVYVGICSPGKSLKTTQVRVVAALMHTAQRQFGALGPSNIDPYWTVVYYFNSLRELGGALRLIDDDIPHRLEYLANADGLGFGRAIRERRELTSRVAAKDISSLLRRMEERLESGNALDALLATNMISVGVDIQRFGLMLVTGQPKTSAEYIQATSRVGRQTPGLIVTLFNWSRPRDMSHYERFRTFHSMMYRHVEAGSVTPYSARARDKGLHAVYIAVLRLLLPRMAGNTGVQNFDPQNPLALEARQYLIDRARRNDPEEANDTQASLQAFIDGWVEQQARHGSALRYRRPVNATGAAPGSWLLEAAEDAEGPGFPKGTLNSLREVEKTSGLYFKNFKKAAGKP
jgi:hypothetical protein